MLVFVCLCAYVSLFAVRLSFCDVLCLLKVFGATFLVPRSGISSACTLEGSLAPCCVRILTQFDDVWCSQWRVEGGFPFVYVNACHMLLCMMHFYAFLRWFVGQGDGDIALEAPAIAASKSFPLHKFGRFFCTFFLFWFDIADPLFTQFNFRLFIITSVWVKFLVFNICFVTTVSIAYFSSLALLTVWFARVLLCGQLSSIEQLCEWKICRLGWSLGVWDCRCRARPNQWMSRKRNNKTCHVATETGEAAPYYEAFANPRRLALVQIGEDERGWPFLNKANQINHG